jgi:hypothetical protein
MTKFIFIFIIGFYAGWLFTSLLNLHRAEKYGFKKDKREI